MREIAREAMESLADKEGLSQEQLNGIRYDWVRRGTYCFEVAGHLQFPLCPASARRVATYLAAVRIHRLDHFWSKPHARLFFTSTGQPLGPGEPIIEGVVEIRSEAGDLQELKLPPLPVPQPRENRRSAREEARCSRQDPNTALIEKSQKSALRALVQLNDLAAEDILALRAREVARHQPLLLLRSGPCIIDPRAHRVLQEYINELKGSGLVGTADAPIFTDPDGYQLEILPPPDPLLTALRHRTQMLAAKLVGSHPRLEMLPAAVARELQEHEKISIEEIIGVNAADYHQRSRRIAIGGRGRSVSIESANALDLYVEAVKFLGLSIFWKESLDAPLLFKKDGGRLDVREPAEFPKLSAQDGEGGPAD